MFKIDLLYKNDQRKNIFSYSGYFLFDHLNNAELGKKLSRELKFNKENCFIQYHCYSFTLW